MLFRIVMVLVASSAGLGIGSLIYYALLQDNIIYKGSNQTEIIGRVIGGISVAWFLLVVYILHLNELPAIIVATLGMTITKLMWDIADGLRYAGHIHEAVMGLTNDTQKTKEFVRSTRKYRQTQDLRAVALTIFAPNSQQIRLLDEIIYDHNQKSQKS